MAPDIATPHHAVLPNILGPSGSSVLAVVNQKGGVGKTTTAINLGGRRWPSSAIRVLLVDLDPQANSTSGLGLDPSRARLTVYHLLTGRVHGGAGGRADRSSRPPARPFARSTWPAPRSSSRRMTERETRLRKALATTPDGIELVIIDCPPSLGLLTLNALAAATQMLIPTQCEYFALEGLRHLFYTHQLVRSSLNPRARDRRHPHDAI